MRDYLANRLYDVMTDMIFASSPIDKTLMASLLDARATHGGKHQIVEDIQRNPLTYNRIVMGAFILGRKLAEATPGEKTIGVLLAQCRRDTRHLLRTCRPLAAFRPCSISRPVP